VRPTYAPCSIQAELLLPRTHPLVAQPAVLFRVNDCRVQLSCKQLEHAPTPPLVPSHSPEAALLLPPAPQVVVAALLPLTLPPSVAPEPEACCWCCPCAFFLLAGALGDCLPARLMEAPGSSWPGCACCSCCPLPCLPRACCSCCIAGAPAALPAPLAAATLAARGSGSGELPTWLSGCVPTCAAGGT
jgi:hypothetical protein